VAGFAYQHAARAVVFGGALAIMVAFLVAAVVLDRDGAEVVRVGP
jgi:hypothetical protein